MTDTMNRGARTPQLPKFNREARMFMTDEEYNEWRALDNVSQGASNTHSLMLADRARRRLDIPEYDPDQYQRGERRAIMRRAKATANKLAYAVRRAIVGGVAGEIHETAVRYFKSYAVRYLALSAAWETMKRSERPHIGTLRALAANLNAFKLEFEVAQLFSKGRDWGCAGQARNRAPRPILKFRIIQRARQQMVLKLLKVCYGEFYRDDQYCVVSRGREQAVLQAMIHMRNPMIEFVAECDVSNFFPSVGEIAGPFGSTQTLRNQFPMLPRAVIDSTVLSSGIIAEAAIHEDMDVLSRSNYAKTGMPQGSALSSYLAELIMSTIMSEAETLLPRGVHMISYVDNIGLFGSDADDVNVMMEPLAVSARNSSYGSFDLRRSQTTRHKSQGFIFLGYFLKYDRESLLTLIEVSDHNQTKFQNSIDRALRQCHPRNSRTTAELASNRERVLQKLYSWSASFRLATDIRDVAGELFLEVLRDHDRRSQRYFQRHIATHFCPELAS